MKVSLAICTYNHSGSLAATLQSLKETVIPKGWDVELLVVDNASTDDTSTVINSFVPNNGLIVRSLFEQRQGQCFARNMALAESTGEIILFTDDDVRVPAQWIEPMSAPILRGEADAVAGGIRLAPHLERPWMTWLHKSLCASTEYLDDSNPESMIGANMAFSRTVLRDVPEFDTELGPGALGFHDESLFSFQLKEAGYKIVTGFDAIVEHHFDESRLRREYLMETLRKMGASSAYRTYHWEHKDIAHPRAQAALWRARLLKWRATKPRWPHAEGMPEWEAWMLWQYYINRYYVIEKRRPRNYEKRGLIKLNHRKVKTS